MGERELTLVLVRVGPTTWDSQGRLCGCADVPPAAGCIEAACTAILAAVPTVELVLAGRDQASNALASAVAESTGATARSHPGLSEISIGLWEGMLADEAEQRYPSLYRRWKLDPTLVTPPNGEPIMEAQSRLIDAMRRSIGRVPSTGRTVVVLLRPLAYGAVVAGLKGQSGAELWTLAEGPERVTRITIEGGQLSVDVVRARVGA